MVQGLFVPENDMDPHGQKPIHPMHQMHQMHPQGHPMQAQMQPHHHQIPPAHVHPQHVPQMHPMHTVHPPTHPQMYSQGHPMQTQMQPPQTHQPIPTHPTHPTLTQVPQLAQHDSQFSQPAYHGTPLSQRPPTSVSYPHSYQMFIPTTVTTPTPQPAKRKLEDGAEEPPTKKLRPSTAPPEESDSESDSGSDNPKGLDYFLADSLLQQKFDPADLYSMMGEEEGENDTEEYKAMRRQRRLKALLKLYKMQYHRLRDILETKQYKFLKQQAEHVQKHSKVIFSKKKVPQPTLPEPVRLAAQQQVNQQYANYHDLKVARSTLLQSPNDELATTYHTPATLSSGQ